MDGAKYFLDLENAVQQTKQEWKFKMQNMQKTQRNLPIWGTNVITEEQLHKLLDPLKLELQQIDASEQYAAKLNSVPNVQQHQQMSDHIEKCLQVLRNMVTNV